LSGLGKEEREGEVGWCGDVVHGMGRRRSGRRSRPPLGSRLTDRTTTAAQDVDIIRRVGAGDRAAMRPLVARYQGPLYAFVLRMVRRPAVAEELVQETFVRAFQAAARYEPTATVSTWLFHIAANLAMNEAGRAHHVREVASELPDGPTDAPGPLQQLEQLDLARAVDDALGRLPAEQRAAVVLARFEDMPYREIGAVLGISEGAVDGLLQRARRTLAKLLRHVEHAEHSH
jgi:RNA polymerase sigma-70 factor (ECF subfamily)